MNSKTCQSGRMGALPSLGMAVLLLCAMAAAAQGTAGWKITGDGERALQLAGVGQMIPGSWHFTFQNVASKPIIAVQFAPPQADGEQTSEFDSFEAARAVAPGETVESDFGEESFVSGGRPDKELSVYAVLFADGTQLGPGDAFTMREANMLGTVLEKQHILNMLRAQPGGSIEDLKTAALAIRAEAPLTNANSYGLSGDAMPGRAEIVARVNARLAGLALPGIAAATVERWLEHDPQAVMLGMQSEQDVELGTFQQSVELGLSPTGLDKVSAAIRRIQVGGKTMEMARLQREMDWQVKVMQAVVRVAKIN